MTLLECNERGKRDYNRGRSPIFRRKDDSIVPDYDDDMADDWTQEMRQAYVEGYYEE